MAERYRSLFLTALVLTILWLVVILLCLPQDENLEQWATSSSLLSSDLQENVGSIRKQEIDRSSHPSDFPEITNHYQNKLMQTSELLFYKLNLFHPIESLNLSSSISKKKHDELMLKLGLVESPTDEYIKSEGYKLFAFNLLVSNQIGLFRALPDTRHEKCLVPNSSNTSTINIELEITLKASIIICYYNEAPSALLRTIHTVLKRSSHKLLHEIIIVDDFSSNEYHNDKIKPFINSNLVKLNRTDRREGLIRARLFGAQIASGDVLIFLDSHVEANAGWLEPLLRTVQDDRTAIACPMIDLINAETLIYSSSPMVKGGLNWALNFKWDSVPSNKLKTYDDFIKPIESPTMAGGLFAIDRLYFYHLGSYDSGMELWGGENIELSLRAWMCGGRILILPCSRLGHIFRKSRPYGPRPGQPDSLLINSHRTARVWLDEFEYKFYEANREAMYLSSGDVSLRLELRHKLNCHNFSWYLDNIYPELKKNLRSLDESVEAKIKPKLFNFSPKRVNRSTDWKNKRMTSTNHLSVKSLSQRQVPHHYSKQFIESENSSSDKPKIGVHTPKFPKIISQFQIRSSGSNFCIESKSTFLVKDFTRLVLSHCAEIRRNVDGIVSITNSTNLNQLWTETDLHDYRLGGDQCLDLIKNFPLLRKCHGMGSFQAWNHSNQTLDTNIYNSGGGLCLGVERIQYGEPVIVTICDRRFIEKKDYTKTLIRTRPHITRHINNMATNWLPLVNELELNEAILEMPILRPCQRWDLVYPENSTNSAI